MTEADPHPRVDPEHPWPALLSFREDDQQYFGGRKEEVEALYRRIASSRLTLLFGLSGLGKTSLLRAGLFPRLRGEHYFPVYIRLRYGRDLPTPVAQIKAEIVAQARAARIEAPEPRPDETLWQYFHRGDADFWDKRNYPSTPVLVFDQFEEIFTKSREVAEHANEVIEELANLAEGASPARLREAAERDPSLLKQVFEDRYRLLIGIRSDYLAQLQGISDRVRAVFANRYELHRMSGAAALESTLTAGGRLLDEDVARRIVRFVAGAEESSDADASVDELQVEPALLSLVCSELNATRLERREPRITASMLSGTKDEILWRFYEASFADVSPELRVLVEDKLVTRDGKGRNFISEQTARETAGVTEEDLANLVHRRLLRFEESGSSRRMELTHDLLTMVAAASRATREQRRQIEEAQKARIEAEQREESARRKLRRSRAATLVFFVLLAAAVAGPFIATRWTSTRANRVEGDYTFRLALQKLVSDEPSEGLAYLARVIRLDRGHSAARTLLYQQLATRSWPVPIRTFGPQRLITDAVFSNDGARVVFRVGSTIEMWDVAKGQRIGSLDDVPLAQTIAFASDDWTLLFSPGAYSDDRQLALWIPRMGWRKLTIGDVRKLPGLPRCHNLQVFDVSANGEELAVGCDGLTIVSLRGKRPIEMLVSRYGSSRFAPDPRFVVVADDTILDRRPPGAATVRHDLGPGESLSGFSRDGKSVLIMRDGTAVEAWDLESWKGVGRKFSNESPTRWAIFDSPGNTVMTSAEDDRIRLWNVDEGRRLFEPLRHADLRVTAFSSDGARVFTASNRQALWWSVHDGTWLAAPITQPDTLAAHLDPRGNIVMVSNAARVWRLATTLLPPVLENGMVAAFSLDRETVTVYAEEGRTAAFDTATGAQTWKSPAGFSVAAIDPHGSRAIVLDDQSLSLVDALTWQPVWTVPRDRVSPDGIFMSGDRTAIVLERPAAQKAENGSFIVRSAATGAVLAPPIDATGQSLMHMSRDGSLLAFRSEGKVLVWDVRKGRSTLTIPDEKGLRIEFSPDGRQLAALSLAGLRVWETAIGGVRAAKREEGEKLVAATFSPDGRRLAVISEKGVALCDSRTLDCTEEKLAHPIVNEVEFSADGRRLLTRAYGELRVWDVSTKRPLSLPLPQDWDAPSALSPDGTSVFGVKDGVLYRVRLPSIDDSDAERLADLGEALAGLRIDRMGVTEPVEGTQALADLEKRCKGVESQVCGMVGWFRAPAGKRTISPVSNVSVAEYVKRQRLADPSPGEWWRLKALFPDEPALGTAP